MESSNLSFRDWFVAMHLMTSTKKGISAKEMQRQLGFKRYEPVWFMMQKIRVAMGTRDERYELSGFTEMDEMRHAEWLIGRIIFFEDSPTVSKINTIKIGKTVPEMINNDHNNELEVVRSYNEAIKLAREVDDQGSVDLLTKILKEEEDHVDWAQIQIAQIEQMGISNYLANQTENSTPNKKI